MKARFTIDDLGVKTYKAQILEVAVSEMLSKHGYEGLASRLQIEERMDSILRHMVWTLRGYVAGKDDVTTRFKTVRYPADWWQAFKLEHFPAWAQVQYPVRYKEETFEVSRHHTKMCPHVGLGPHRDHIDWLFLDEPFTTLYRQSDEGNQGAGQEGR